MTDAEILDIVRDMIGAEERHSPPGQSGWVLGQLKKLRAALEANPPLAEVEGRAHCMPREAVWYVVTVQFVAEDRPATFPVAVTIRKRP